MRYMKISTALLAVPLCLVALACENATDTGQPEALTNPSGPSDAHDDQSDDGFPFTLANGCLTTVGVTQSAGGRVVRGTAGDDAINCNDYNGVRGVTVFAGDGNDLIVGSMRNDRLFGGRGCDRVEGGLGGNDLVVGGPGNDNNGCVVPDYANADPSIPVHIPGGLFGGPGDDLVIGGPGDDDLNGGDGTDRCFGGPGTNTFIQCDNQP